MSVAVGQKAPEFTLLGSGGKSYSLSDYAGKPVVLVFYPGDNTAVCTKQLRSYNNELAQFDGVGAQVLGVSAQDVASHDAFSAKHGFGFPLLADTDRGSEGVRSRWIIGHGETQYFCSGCSGDAPVCAQICGRTYLSSG